MIPNVKLSFYFFLRRNVILIVSTIFLGIGLIEQIDIELMSYLGVCGAIC